MMTTPIQHEPDPSLDLVMERTVDVRPELVWKAWTTPELLEQWFTPKPWRTTDVAVDLRPGGAFRTTMRGPEGEVFEGASCYLEIVPNEKLVWTNALAPGYRPRPAPGADDGDFLFTAVITMTPEGKGTKYRALVIHADQGGRERHAAMGFHDGWGAAFDQLIALLKS